MTHESSLDCSAPNDMTAHHPAQHLLRLPICRLRPGMFVHDIGRGWLYHPFWRKRFRVGEKEIARLRAEGIDEVWVDLRRGDVPPGLLVPEADPSTDRDKPSISLRELREQRMRLARTRISLEEERWRMRHFRRDAVARLKPIFAAAREGRPPSLSALYPIVERLIESVLRHPDALIPQLRLKPPGEYLPWHALACAALTVAIGRAAGADEDEMPAAAMGALLMDIGLNGVPSITEARTLEPGERRQMQAHVPAAVALLADAADAQRITLEIAAQHHERLDGSGYPLHLSDKAISPWARAAALADCYDALVSPRPWRSAYTPTEALALIGQGIGRLFCPQASQALVDAIGVFPVGSLVRLAQPNNDGDLLAVVLAQRRGQLAQPVVRAIYDVRERRYIRPVMLDLARRHDPPIIVSAESWSAWQLDEARWQPQ